MALFNACATSRTITLDGSTEQHGMSCGTPLHEITIDFSLALLTLLLLHPPQSPKLTIKSD